MSRYIDVDKGMPLIDEFGKRYCMTVCNILNCKEIIAKIPTADVQEVRHGHWIGTGDPIFDGTYSVFRCSICGYTYSGSKDNYCGSCGAKMDEEEQE